jgi:hypothetical protein
MIPILLSFGRRNSIPVKKLLIPMSFATVLGGTITIIGTSTNLVVSGLQQVGGRVPAGGLCFWGGYSFGGYCLGGLFSWGVPAAGVSIHATSCCEVL